jgi:hypothetical protein
MSKRRTVDCGLGNGSSAVLRDDGQATDTLTEMSDVFEVGS